MTKAQTPASSPNTSPNAARVEKFTGRPSECRPLATYFLTLRAESSSMDRRSPPMTVPRRLLVTLFGVAVAAVFFALLHDPLAAVPATAPQRTQITGSPLYDTSVLHRIDIVIPAEDANKLLNRTDTRIRCTFTIDGRTLHDVGVRQAGGIYHPYVPITNKPSLSLKFDEFTRKQELFGVDRLVLKN